MRMKARGCRLAIASAWVACGCACNAVFGLDRLEYDGVPPAPSTGGGGETSSKSSTTSTSSTSSTASVGGSSGGGGTSEPGCGNGIQEFGEQCDDGNDVSSDGCTNDCHTARCGDAIVWVGAEECDGELLASVTCESLGFLQGTVTCSEECTFDVSACVACGDCKSCTRTECYRDIWWWQNSTCTVPFGSCQPCAHWGPASSTHPDGSFFCNANGTSSPYWNGGPCDWVETDYIDDCDMCGAWSC